MAIAISELTTTRLKLRPFSLEDVAVVTELCSDWDIARTTANIPHPYDEAIAEAWISSHAGGLEAGESATFAITDLTRGQVLGAIGLHIIPANLMGEIGYWIGKPYWNLGYATEAVRAVLKYGFDHLGLNRIQARHMTLNPASGRVMEKAGMTIEGILRQSIFRWGSFEDAAIYAMLREEYDTLE